MTKSKLLAIKEDKLSRIQKDQVVQWTELWEKARRAEADDPVLAGQWSILRAMMASKATQISELPEQPVERVVGKELAWSGYLLEEWGDEPILVRDIAGRLMARFPEMRHAYKEEDLPAWIRCVTYIQLSALATDAKSKTVFIEEGARAVEPKIERLLPRNPVRLEETFKDYARDEMAKFHFEARDATRDPRTARPVGRPKKSAEDRPSKAAQGTLPENLATLADDMRSRKKNSYDIARACYPNLPPADCRTPKMRSHVVRLIDKGFRLRKKRSTE